MRTPATTWWGKWAAMKTLERQTHTWTPQNTVHRTAFRYLSKHKCRQKISSLRMPAWYQSGSCWSCTITTDTFIICLSWELQLPGHQNKPCTPSIRSQWSTTAQYTHCVCSDKLWVEGNGKQPWHQRGHESKSEVVCLFLWTHQSVLVDFLPPCFLLLVTMARMEVTRV